MGPHTLIFTDASLIEKSFASTMEGEHSNINTKFTTITFGKLIYLVTHYTTFKSYINYIIK